ncbi:MAG: DUF3307 domain-containing protein [candidate division WOR-3 bacterium]|nr:MAG: DUF3307 domain-containing protein [candidate division WOR-3 bacterium]UCF06927.1 MAG: DUF3307 domain-containing protein [bacterium]
MTVFESMLVAHLLGDWLLQTEWQAVNKKDNWHALVTHVLIYHVVLYAVLAARYGFWNSLVFIVVALLAVTHAILDLRRPVEWFIRTFRLSINRHPSQWLVIVIDQSIHIILIGLASLWLSHGMAP